MTRCAAGDGGAPIVEPPGLPAPRGGLSYCGVVSFFAACLRRQGASASQSPAMIEPYGSTSSVTSASPRIVASSAPATRNRSASASMGLKAAPGFKPQAISVAPVIGRAIGDVWKGRPAGFGAEPDRAALRCGMPYHAEGELSRPCAIRRRQPCFASAFVSSGTTVKRSPTSPKSATWKIAASSSLLMATITLESFMPARCWMAPEMPTAT